MVNNGKPIIEVRDLDFYYSDFKALDGICMEVARNDVTALIGPSGCGKSTFLRLLNRMNELIPGTRVDGQVLLDGVNLYDPNVDVVEVRRRVGMVFQKPNPFPKSIYNNVAYGPRLHGTRSKSVLDGLVEESLKASALWDEVKDILHQSAMGLSGGQQQRLCIARAVAMKPETLLMDEPTSALDPIATARIEEAGQGAEKALHGGHRHPQHAAGGARVRHHRLLLHGKTDRSRAHRGHFHQAQQGTDRAIHHRTFRLARKVTPWELI